MLEELINNISQHLIDMSATQVLRLLHGIKKHCAPTMGIKLISNPNLHYHQQEIEKVALIKNDDPIVEVTLNITGMFGAAGIMPNHYTYDVLRNIKVHNTAMVDFLNLLQQGILEQFLQAKLLGILVRNSDYPELIDLLKCLMGGSQFANEQLLAYLPSLQQPHVTANTLAWIMTEQLQCKVEIIENSKRYFPLPDTNAFCLGKDNQLGKTTIAGNYVRADHQHITVKIYVKNALECHRLYHDAAFQTKLTQLLQSIVGFAQAYLIDYNIEDVTDNEICLGFSSL